MHESLFIAFAVGFAVDYFFGTKIEARVQQAEAKFEADLKAIKEKV